MNNENHIEEQSISLAEIYDIVKKNFIFLVIITLLFGLLLGIYAFNIAVPKYKSVGNIMVQVQTEGKQDPDSVASIRLIETVKGLLVDVGLVPEKTSENLAEKHNIILSKKDIVKGLTVKTSSTSQLVTITYVSENKDDVYFVVSTLIDTLIAVAEDPELGIDKTFLDNIVRLDVEEAEYVSPNKAILILVGLIIGGTLGLIIVFIRETMFGGYKFAEDLEKQTKTLVLGVIPKFNNNVKKDEEK